tara:strand:+ start:2566 stop:4197 length:1632 start_codon:yes stop_codon:yes gene_type:complete
MHINVSSYLSVQAERNPDSSALCFASKDKSHKDTSYDRLSFKELEAATSAQAHYFDALGISEGTRVLMMVRPGIDLIQIVFSLLKIGAIPVVIDPGMGLSNFFKCAHRSKVSVIIGEPIATTAALFYRKSTAEVQLKITIDSKFKKRVQMFQGLGTYKAFASNRDDLAAILFTSGSTGSAKGVRYTHGIFSAQIELIQKQYGIQAGEVDCPMLPVFALFNPAMGMCTVVPEMNPSRPAKVNPRKIVQSILDNQVTNSFGSPAIWARIVRYCEAEGITFPSLKRVIMAGAPAPQDLLIRLKKLLPAGEIFTPYGATEALPVSSISATDILEKQSGAFALGRKGICVGRPFPSIKVKIIEVLEGEISSIDQLEVSKVGSIGEIIVSGPSVTKSYDQLETETKLSKIKDGPVVWHRMGDLGWIDETGNLWFCGRKAERVKTPKGYLETTCCEAIFNQLESVARSALVDLGGGTPGIIIEPELGCFPKSASEKKTFVAELRKLALNDSDTRMIEHFYFEKNFPVDIRHNAKIHRLSLAKKWSAKHQA